MGTAVLRGASPRPVPPSEWTSVRPITRRRLCSLPVGGRWGGCSGGGGGGGDCRRSPGMGTTRLSSPSSPPSPRLRDAPWEWEPAPAAAQPPSPAGGELPPPPPPADKPLPPQRRLDRRPRLPSRRRGSATARARHQQRRCTPSRSAAAATVVAAPLRRGGLACGRAGRGTHRQPRWWMPLTTAGGWHPPLGMVRGTGWRRGLTKGGGGAAGGVFGGGGVGGSGSSGGCFGGEKADCALGGEARSGGWQHAHRVACRQSGGPSRRICLQRRRAGRDGGPCRWREARAEAAGGAGRRCGCRRFPPPP